MFTSTLVHEINGLNNYYYYIIISLDFYKQSFFWRKQGPFRLAKKQVPFNMAIENVEPLEERLPKHLRMGTIRILKKLESKKTGVNNEITKEMEVLRV